MLRFFTNGDLGGKSLKTRGHGDTGTRGQIGWGFDPNQFYAPYRRWGI
ncbi:MAG: hypothetical protein F6K58_11180 [Symploca sp. SIO2E9]|nr:hypothetical protein [Symploca sp. SIO2E9]